MSENTVNPLWKPEYKPDTVYLHVLPRSLAGGEVVNISPFAIKLELWLRINQIPFETVDYMGFSSKGQSPFILFNGDVIADSNFSIEILSKQFNKDPLPGLNAVDKAIARAFIKMMEENTTWPIFIYRYAENMEEYANFFQPKGPKEVKMQILGGIKESLPKRAHGHGIGRHSSEEVQKIGCDDVRAISDFLGDKSFMMGNTPTLVDCVMFGVLSQVVYVNMGYPQRKYILDNCPNIVRLMDKLKTTYWSNWEAECQL